MPVPRAQLRIFTPLEAFAAADRDHWRRYVEQGRGLTREQVAAAEWGASVATLMSARVPSSGGAVVRRLGRRVLVCPLDLDLRVATALAAFRAAVPEPVRSAVGPEVTAPRPLLAGGRAPHVLDAPWAVPLAWFAVFAPRERRFLDPPEGRGPRVVHLTGVGQAQDRATAALEILEDGLEPGDELVDVLAEPLAELGNWLAAFDPTALLELDFGPVGRLLGRERLSQERTCQDLWRLLEAVQSGDPVQTAAAHAAARARWADVAAKATAS